MEITKQNKTTLETFKSDDGLEIIIDTNTGESFASIKGYARISGVTPGGISKRVSKLGVSSSLVRKAELVTVTGLQGVSLITEDLIAEWLPKDNPQMATAFMKLGIRMYMHTAAGFTKVDSVSKEDLYLVKQELINEIRATNAPINRLDIIVKESQSKLLEAIKKLKELQPRTNQILSVIPSGYLSYSEFKDVYNYTFKRGVWAVVERNLDTNKVINKSPLNSVKYFNEQEVIKTINDLSLAGTIQVNFGSTGRAKQSTVSF